MRNPFFKSEVVTDFICPYCKEPIEIEAFQLNKNDKKIEGFCPYCKSYLNVEQNITREFKVIKHKKP